MAISDALITALVGMAVVFAVLIILMCAIKIMALVFSKVNKPEVATPSAAPTPAATVTAATAPGSCGGLVLKNVSDRDAAMIMAIVADELGTPLNELRFTSIKLEDQN